MLPRDKKLRPRATEMRNHATKVENHLWYDFLRTYPIQFYRQYIIGEYIADFFCPRAKLIIELDGMHHLARKEYDTIRTETFASLGLQELRFYNYEVKDNFQAVCDAIDVAVKTCMACEKLQ